MIPSKLGFPRATTACEVRSAKPKVAVPTSADNPPTRFSGKPDRLFI
jgi:hypothetical protein